MWSSTTTTSSTLPCHCLANMPMVAEPERVRGIAYMEALVRPVTWEEWPEPARKVFQAMRSPAGEEMVLTRRTSSWSGSCPRSVLRGLGEAEMAVYRRPYLEPGESRRPTLTWPRQIPIEGEPADVVAIADAYARWLATQRRAEALRQRRPGRDPHRAAARVLPAVAEPAGGHREGQSLHPGGLAATRSARRWRRSWRGCRRRPSPCPLPWGRERLAEEVADDAEELVEPVVVQPVAGAVDADDAWRGGTAAARPSSAGLPERLSLP